jgi:hypothetical protein
MYQVEIRNRSVWVVDNVLKASASFLAEDSVADLIQLR